MTLLLHACCAPCTAGCIETAGTADLFWFNPNIHPFTEYKLRMDALIAFGEELGLPVIIGGEYGLREFVKAVEPNDRCGYCYEIRLDATAKYAKEQGYGGFSTTLLISPYQNHDLIRRTGEKAAEKYEIPFVYHDFRPNFRVGQKAAREKGIYMQKYCGCIFSEEERYMKS